MSNFIPKELSWLAFNKRLLQEANNKSVPLIERLKFLGIYASNLDEFYKVKVAILKRNSKTFREENGEIDTEELGKEINNTVFEHYKSFKKIHTELLQELEENNVFFVDEKNITKEQRKYTKQYFTNKIRPKLIPIMLDNDVSLEHIKDNVIYLAVCLKSDKESKHALIEIPSKGLKRFVIIPSKDNNTNIIFLDDIIRLELQDIFYSFKFNEIESYSFRITRDAQLSIDEDSEESYLSILSASLKDRTKGNPVRFIYDSTMPDYLLNFFKSKLEIKSDDSIIVGGRYHHLKDLSSFPKIKKASLNYEPLPPVSHKEIKPYKSILKTIRKKDILLHFPYHSFSTFIDLLREAAIDPKVTSIKITLYRLAKNSSVINALINAVKNGKKVEAVLELQARFDEEANIFWYNKLKEEGVKVIHGKPGQKVHSKLCLISRNEKDGIRRYSCIGTGNFNEDTAKVYNDIILLTSNNEIGNDVENVFNSLNYLTESSLDYKKLLVSPIFMRNRIKKLIRKEIENAKKGRDAYIRIKVNNLADQEISKLLYEANDCGVKIELNIRGMMFIDKDNPSKNIDAFGIIDRYLEHSRIFCFCNNNEELYFIGSADLLPRNLNRRVEVLCPIFDDEIKSYLKTILDTQRDDNTKSRLINKVFNNYIKVNDKKPEIRSQYDLYYYLKKQSEESKRCE